MNERLQKLKQHIFQTRELCTHRARLVTESYRETEGKPVIMRRALALEKILLKMPIFILPDELVVGNHASTPQGVPLFPEFSSAWLEEEMEDFASRGYAVSCGERETEELLEILPYWRGRTVHDRMLEIFEKQVDGIDPLEEEIARTWLRKDVDGMGHLSLDHGIVLSGGLTGIEENVKSKLETLDPSDPSHEEKKNLYEAMLITCRAITAFANRFAELAEQMAGGEKDAKRKAELLEIAQNCRRVPQHHPETFWQAVQAFWFNHLVTSLESNGHAIGPGRFDQYMYPYFEADVRENGLTEKRATELIGCAFIKIALIAKLRSHETSEAYAGHSMFQNLTIGGQDINGLDVVNRVSYLVLDCVEDLQLIQPTVSFRYHPDTPREFLLRAVDVLSRGSGMPVFFNDRRIIETLESRGVPTEEARRFCMLGCVVPFLPGIAGELWGHAGVPPIPDSYHNLPGILLLALNDGIDPMTGKRHGPPTGPVESITDMNVLLELFRQQLRFSMEASTHAGWARSQAQAELTPRPWLSMLVNDCVDKGKDIRHEGARYYFKPVMMTGLPNIVDSLAAIDKFVFNEKAVTLEGLLQALHSNFEGREELRLMLLNRAPKYGNDIGEVDELGERCVRILTDETAKYDFPGFWTLPFLQTIAKHVVLGRGTGATPDGRLAGEPIADGGASPAYGMDKNGPTAVFRTAARMHNQPIAASILNMKFSPLTLRQDGGYEKLAALVQTYFEMGGHHVQFNIVDAKTLAAAQQSPELYSDLVVRVAGFSAYFTQLETALQDEIIARTEHCL